MKAIKVCLGIAIVACLTSCSNTTEAGHATNNADSAVLVKDTANTLNAKPVNDTAVNATTK